MNASILEKALALGASTAGLIDLDDEVAARIQLPGAIPVPMRRGAVLVLALAHAEEHPELDWWGGPGGTEGNRRLQQISARLRDILAEGYGIRSRALPYPPWKGGILLKNAAALAGLGVIGANNLLITPQCGPRVRLRAMVLERPKGTGFFEPTGGRQNPVYNPCEGCPRPCWRACPQDAFASGAYDRERCIAQMDRDERRAPIHEDRDSGVRYIAYCRACEYACPVGR